MGTPPRKDRIRYTLYQGGGGRETIVCAARSGFKLVWDGEDGRMRLHDLHNDPMERADVIREHSQEAELLRKWLGAWRWAQVDYYRNPERHPREYPPVIRDP